MLRRELKELALYWITQENESIQLDGLKDLYIDKTSEIVYIIYENKLYGIICMSEIVQYSRNGEVKINRNFTKLVGYNIIKAHQIFRNNKRIHQIPIVNDQGELLGDYSRWDDMLYIEQNCKYVMKKKLAKQLIGHYDRIIIAEPAENTNASYLWMLEELNSFGVEYTILSKKQIQEQICDIILENLLCIFLTEEESRGMKCLCQIEIAQHDKTFNGKWKLKFDSFKNLLIQMKYLGRNEAVKINNINSQFWNKQPDEESKVFITALKEKGANCFILCTGEKGLSEYCNNLKKEINERFIEHPLRKNQPWPTEKDNSEFYGELLKQDDYKEEIAQQEIFDGFCSFEYKKEVSGRYFNAKKGRRITCFQPKEFLGTIYLIGVCTVLSSFVEDQYTIESYMQKKLLERGINYRVENFGTILRNWEGLETRLQEIDNFFENDIFVMSTYSSVEGIPEISLDEIYERHKIPSTWLVDVLGHCNHKTNSLIADDILNMLEPCLQKGLKRKKNNKNLHIDINSIMENYVYCLYLNQYFKDIDCRKYDSIGAIVANCNPFTMGHHYLIETAKKQVDFLIVFVVEDEVIPFTFEERFKMVQEGIKNMDHVMAVPSGDFVLSKSNFPEYFSKRSGGSVRYNAEYNVNLFADYIAKPLHITHRFAGEEHDDKIKKVYNEVMSNVLPMKGINFVEIPRLTINNEEVSTYKLQRYLYYQEYEKAAAMIPEMVKPLLV